MGNSQHRYLAANDGREVIGQRTWQILRLKLDKLGSHPSIDLVQFSNIIRSRYERVVSL